MTKGSPGAILVLALGAVFLSLGWTGRYPAVWEALRTGKSENEGAQNPVTDNNIGAAAIQDPQAVFVLPNWTEKVTDAPNVVGPEPGQTCKTGSSLVSLVKGKRDAVYCVANDKLFDPLPIQTKPTYQAGQVDEHSGHFHEDDNMVMLPTGIFGVENSPNAKGFFYAD